MRKKTETAYVSINAYRINTRWTLWMMGAFSNTSWNVLCQPINLYPRLSTASVVSHKWMNEIIRLSPKLTGTVYFSINWLDAHTHNWSDTKWLVMLRWLSEIFTHTSYFLTQKMDFQQPRIHIVYKRRFIRNNFNHTNKNTEQNIQTFLRLY